MARWVGWLSGLALVAGGVYWYAWGHADSAPLFRFGEVKRGDLMATISATGTIQPDDVVDVGAQVAGMIKTLGVDPTDSSRAIDYGAAVEEGTILARIDDAVYAAQVEQAKANLARAEADLIALRARQRQRQRDWERAQNLSKNRSAAITEAELDVAEAENQAANGALGVGEAAVEQAKASLHQAEINLGYTTIRSPVKGVIIDRRVNVGQTVVASLNAPSLFLIAKDLRRLEVWAAVNEADVGQIRTGQPVTFTVDAFPGEVFQGVVGQVRLNATMTQNVVTYTVVVNTDNASGVLLPYLTANLRFEVDRRSDVLLVPNAALRYKPRPELLGQRPGDPQKEKASAPESAAQRRHGTVWKLVAGRPQPFELELGLADATHTEVVKGDVKPGDSLITDEVLASQAAGGTNPFAPQMFGGSRRPGS